MDLLDYRIGFERYTHINKYPFLENYCFLLFTLYHLKLERENHLVHKPTFPIYEYEIHDHHSPEEKFYYRPFNISLTYLEKYCQHDDLIMDLKWHFFGTTYTEFNIMDISKLKDRLLDIVLNQIQELNNEAQFINPVKYQERIGRINPVNLDLYLELENSLEELRNDLNKKNQPYSILLSPDLNNGNDCGLHYSRLIKNVSHDIREGIDYEAFCHDSLFLIGDFTARPYEDYYENFPKMPDDIGLLNMDKFHSRLQSIIESFIKIGLLDEMEKCFKTETTYTPNIFVVKGPAEAVTKYGPWFSSRYNLSENKSITSKLYNNCYKIAEDGSYKRLNVKSISREIRKKKHLF